MEQRLIKLTDRELAHVYVALQRLSEREPGSAGFIAADGLGHHETMSAAELQALAAEFEAGKRNVEVIGQAAPILARFHNTDPYADAFIEAARRKADDYLEIDDVALISASEGGSWVNAWVWVSNDEAGVHPEDEADA